MTSLGTRVLVNVLLLVFAVGLALILWLDPWRESPPERVKLSAIDATQIRRLRIEAPDRPAIELIRQDSAWRLVAPFSLRANQDRVASLLGLARVTVHDAFRAEGNNLREFGLDPPKARLLMDEHEFHFGDTEPLNGWRYVRYGADVHLISDAYSYHLLATAPAFVDPAPIGADARPVGFTLPGIRLRLEEGSWRVDPPQASSNADAGERLAKAWISAKAASVRRFDSDLNWEQTIQVELHGESEPLRFRVARLDREWVIGRPDRKVQYHFPKQAARGLLAPVIEIPLTPASRAEAPPSA
jgi:hypothetical protein